MFIYFVSAVTKRLLTQIVSYNWNHSKLKLKNLDFAWSQNADFHIQKPDTLPAKLIIFIWIGHLEENASFGEEQPNSW